MDDRSAAARSETMRRVKSRGTSCEAALGVELKRRGLRWSRGKRADGVAGKPDFVFWRARVAVFVDGCFWHGCEEHCRVPRGNRAYWERKIARNTERDARVRRELRAAGWRVVRVWEHAVVRSVARCGARVERVVREAEAVGGRA